MTYDLTAAARQLAQQAGRLAGIPGIAHDTTDIRLTVLAEALLEKVEGTGIDILSLAFAGDALVATVDDTAAEEPLCPAAFGRLVRRLSFDLLGDAPQLRVRFVEPASAPAARARVA